MSTLKNTRFWYILLTQECFWNFYLQYKANGNTFKPVNIDNFFYTKFANFLYKSCFLPNLKPIWLQSRWLFFKFCWKKKLLISTKFSVIMSNFYKFSETVYHCEVAYQISKLYHFLFKYKRIFYPPWIWHCRKKTPGPLMHLF